MATVDAEEVRIACTKALLKLATNQQDKAVEILEELGARCGKLARAEDLAADQADLREDRFDLAALKVDMHSAAPEREAD